MRNCIDFAQSMTGTINKYEDNGGICGRPVAIHWGSLFKIDIEIAATMSNFYDATS